jgi:hypothetical protein
MPVFAPPAFATGGASLFSRDCRAYVVVFLDTADSTKPPLTGASPED